MLDMFELLTACISEARETDKLKAATEWLEVEVKNLTIITSLTSVI